MRSFVSSRLNGLLASLVRDFDVKEQVEIDWAAGTLSFNHLQLSQKVLDGISDQVCFLAPVLVKSISVEHLLVDHYNRRVKLQGVVVECETWAAESWDVERIRTCLQDAKLQQLDLHSRFMQCGWMNGEGFLHNLGCDLLDSLEVAVEDVFARLLDRSSLNLWRARPFVVAGGIAEASSQREGAGASSGRGAIFRRLRVRKPYVWLDDAAAEPAMPSSAPQRRFAQQHSPPSIERGSSRSWVLDPDDDVVCELAVLQCWRPVPAPQDHRRWGPSGPSCAANLVHERDIANLADLLEAASADDDGAPQPGLWASYPVGGRAAPSLRHLPRTAVVLGAGPIRLRLRQKELQAAVGIFTYFLLGYLKVVEGVKAGAGAPSPEAVERYRRLWMGRTFLHADAGAADAAAEISAFERNAPFSLVRRVREEAFEAAQEQLAGGAGGFGNALSWLFRGSPDARTARQSAEDFDATLQLVRDALTVRHPGWQKSWQSFRGAECAILVAGYKFQGMTVDLLPDESPLAGAALEGRRCLRFKMEESMSGGAIHKARLLLHSMCRGFSVEDHFAPWKLQQLVGGSDRVRRIPVSTVLVRPRCDAGGDSSWFYVGIGRQVEKSSTEPDGTLCLRSSGELQVCLPPTQILVLLLSVFTPELNLSIRQCFAGGALQGRVQPEVLETMEHGLRVGRDLWSSAANGLSDRWRLDIDMEPVSVVMPLPGATNSAEHWGGGSWQEVYVLSLGRVVGHSTLQPRLPGQSHIKNTLDEELTADDLQHGTFYDKYSAHVLGLTLVQRSSAAMQDGSSPSRTIVMPTESEVSLFLRPWTCAELPQGLVHCRCANVQVALASTDIEAMWSLIWELAGVGVAASTAAARSTLEFAQGALRIGGAAGVVEAGSGDEVAEPVQCLDGKPRVQRARMKAGSVFHRAFDAEPVPGTKLWDVILASDTLRVSLQLPRSSGGAVPEDLHFTVERARFKGYACIGGSMRWSYSVRAIEVGAPSCVFPIYRVATAQTVSAAAEPAGGVEEHLVCSILLEAPESIDDGWTVGVDVAVNRPRLMVCWPLVHDLIAVAMAFLARQGGCRARPAGETDTFVSVLRRAGMAGRTELNLDRVFAHIAVHDPELLVPIEWDPVVRKKTKKTRGGSGLGWAPGGDGRGEQMPVLAVRATLRLSLDFKWPHANRLSRWSTPEALLSTEVRAFAVGVAAQWQCFNAAGVRSSAARDKDIADGGKLRPDACMLGARTASLPLLAPCRCSIEWSGEAFRQPARTKFAVRVRQEAMLVDIFPPSRRLLMDLLGTACACFDSPAQRPRSPSSLRRQSADETPQSAQAGDGRLSIFSNGAQEDLAEVVPVPSGDAVPQQDFRLKVELHSISLRAGDMPGNVELPHAHVVCEAARFDACVLGRAAGVSRVAVSTQGIVRADVLNTMSAQVEPILEPVRWFSRLSWDREEQVPRGSLHVSWMNLNLPVGLFYSAKLWLNAEKSVAPVPAPASLPCGSHDPTLFGSLVQEESTSQVHINRLGHCQIINLLGERIQVRLTSGLADADDDDWREIEPSGLDDPRPREGAPMNDAAFGPAPVVPRLAIRGHLGEDAFTLRVTSRLQVGQYDIVRVPSKSRQNTSIPVLLRAMPDCTGHGCALLICTPVLLRNTTSRTLLWRSPGMMAMSRGPSCERSSEGAGESYQSEALRPATSNRHRSGASPMRGRTRFATSFRTLRLSAGLREESLTRSDRDDRDAMREEAKLLPKRHVLLPLPWLVSAGDPRRRRKLRIGCEGGPPSQILSDVTLQSLLDFDFSQDYREEGLACALAGSLVKLYDREGKPVHVCCTVNLCLSGERVGCLEIVVSSCVDLVNHLSQPISVACKYDSNVFDGSMVEVGGLCQTDLDADELIIQTSVGETMTTMASAALSLRRDDLSREEAIQLIARPKKHMRNRSLSLSRPSERDTDVGAGYALLVKQSAPLQSQPQLRLYGYVDSWLQQLSFFHPPEWKTFHRTLTVFTSCWFENCSSSGVYLRPAGLALRSWDVSEMHIPAGERRMLKVALTSAKKINVCTEELGTPAGSGQSIKLNGKGRFVTKTLRCAGESGADPIYFGAVIRPAQLPFAGSKVIQLYDSVTLLNLLPAPLTCWSGGVGVQVAPAASCPERTRDCIQPLNCKPTGNSLRFCFSAIARSEAGATGKADSAASAEDDDVTRSMISEVAKKCAQQIGLETSRSFQVRMRSGGDRQSSRSYENVSVSIKKLHQGAATLVTFQPGTPNFVITNGTDVDVVISQSGVLTESEVLRPRSTLQFVWYEPKGALHLKAMESVTGQPLKIARDFDPIVGIELRRVMSSEAFAEWERSIRMQSVRGPSVHELVEDTPHFRLCAQGVGLSLSHIAPVEFLYIAAEDLQVAVKTARPRRTLLSQAAASAVGDDAFSVGDRSERDDVSIAPGLRDVSIAPGHSTYAAQSSTPDKHIRERRRWNIEDMTVLMRLALSGIPPLDISASLMNLQADSHVPGCFFPCVLRSFRGRRQFCQSMDLFSAAATPGRPQALSPLLHVEASSFQLIGNAVVMKSFKGSVDRFIVNVDEAFIVAAGAYYSRIAVYFDLPPFDQHTEQPEEDGRKARFTSRASAEHNRIAAMMEKHWTIGESERLAGLEKLASQTQGWLIRVEESLEVAETTAYISMRLTESSDPWVESLQRDAHTSTLLQLLQPFYGAAAFQPTMLSASTRSLCDKRICMSPEALGEICKEHLLDPMAHQLILLLVFTFDFIGNPASLFFGVFGGVRELVAQPFRRGPLVGLPMGIVVCVCSVFGSVLDVSARVSNNAFTTLDRLQRRLYGRLGVQSRQDTAVFVQSQGPMGAAEGLRKAVSTAMVQLLVLKSNIAEVCCWLCVRLRRRAYCALPYCIVFVLVLVLSLLVGLLKVALIFMHNVVQGFVMSLYRRSAEDVGDLSPIQLLAIAIPTHLRPTRNLSAPSPSKVDDDMRGATEGPVRISTPGANRLAVTIPPFAYLPSLAQAQLRVLEDFAFLARQPLSEDRTVVSATPCGSPSAGEGEASILVNTGRHVALLQVTGWGLKESGRQKQPKESYRWAWCIRCTDITAVSMDRVGRGQDWVVRLTHWGVPAARGQEAHQSRTRVVYFLSEHHACRALELLSHLPFAA